MRTTTPSSTAAFQASPPSEKEEARPAQGEGEGASLVLGGQPDIILDAGDLIRDQNGEVVLFNDSQFTWMELLSDQAVVSEGTAEQHITSGGDDVTGFRFIAFADGLTLYYEPPLEVTIGRPAT